MDAHAQPSVQLVLAQCNNRLAQVLHTLGIRHTCTCHNTLSSYRQLDHMQHEHTHLISICTWPSRYLLGEEETFWRSRHEARVTFRWSAFPSSPCGRAQKMVLEEVVQQLNNVAAKHTANARM